MARTLVLVALAAAGLAAQPPTPVILISIDTLRADRLSAYGYTQARTPNIDSFADNGSLFTAISAQVPLTLPSHTTLFTSTYPFANHVEENAQRVPAHPETLASVLRAHGYQTAAFIGSVFLEKQLGLDGGFDVYDSPFSFAALSPLSGEMIFAGPRQKQYTPRDTRGGPLVIRAANQWLAENRGQPVFAFVHLFDLHKPYTGTYDSQLAAVDAVIGSFKQALMRAGWWDRSIVILLSDHGEGLGDHGEDSHGYFIYQSTLHVPLLIHWPRDRHQPQRFEQPGGLIDVAPTILDALHIAVPPSFAGHTLLQRDPARDVFSESVYTRDAFGWSALRSLRSGDFKYIQAPRPELYNLKTDPGERTNLIATHPEQARELSTKLAALLLKATPAQPQVIPNANSTLHSLGYLSSGPKTHSLHPADPKDKLPEYLLYERSVNAGYAGRTDEAVSGLLKVLAQDPRNTLARRDLAQCYIEQRAYLKARASFQQVLAAAPDDYTSHLGISIADQHLGRTKEAADQRKAACQLAPDSADCRAPQ